MTHQGKNAKISEVSKDRLWRDYVSREENHQTYWAVEAQYVKGSLSPEKKNILRNVDTMRDFDATVLLGTTQMQQRQASEPSSPANTQRNKHYNSTNTFKTSSDPNAPSNLLLRQLQMTAAENTQAEEKTLEQLQNYKNNYSSRANLKYKARVAMMSSGENSKGNNNAVEGEEIAEDEDAVVSKKRCDNNIPTPLSPNAFAGSYTAGPPTFSPTESKRVVVSPYHTMNETLITARGTGGGSLSPLSTTRSGGVSPYNSSSPANVQKERTLNNSYCSHYANKDIGIHHYKYNAPARSGGDVQGQHTINGNGNNGLQQQAAHTVLGGSPLSSLNGTASSPQRPHGLPPLSLHKAQSPTNNTAHLSSQTLSPLCSSRVYQHELEVEASIVSPKRSYVEHGLLTPKMGVRVASATGRRGYGQRIASSHEEAYAMRPPVELNERSQHGYRKWN